MKIDIKTIISLFKEEEFWQVVAIYHKLGADKIISNDEQNCAVVETVVLSLIKCGELREAESLMSKSDCSLKRCEFLLLLEQKRHASALLLIKRSRDMGISAVDEKKLKEKVYSKYLLGGFFPFFSIAGILYIILSRFDIISFGSFQIYVVLLILILCLLVLFKKELTLRMFLYLLDLLTKR